MDTYEACCWPHCAARSYVFALMRNGGMVTYCGHHATQVWARLSEQAVEIDDRRDRILKADDDE